MIHFFLLLCFSVLKAFINQVISFNSELLSPKIKVFVFQFLKKLGQAVKPTPECRYVIFFPRAHQKEIITGYKVENPQSPSHHQSGLKSSHLDTISPTSNTEATMLSNCKSAWTACRPSPYSSPLFNGAVQTVATVHLFSCFIQTPQTNFETIMVYFLTMPFFICSARDQAQALRQVGKQSLSTAEWQEPSHIGRLMTNDAQMILKA